MKELIKSLLTEPIFRLCLLISFLIYSTLFILSINKKPKLSLILEKAFVIFLLFCIAKVSISPFSHMTPVYLIEPPLNFILANSQVAIYGFMILILWSRINIFLKRKVFATLLFSIIKNPFIWLLVIMSITSSLWSETPMTTFKASVVLAAINIISIYIAEQQSWPEISFLFSSSMSIIAFFSLFIRNKTNALTTEGGGGGLAGILPSKNQLGSMMAFCTVLCLIQATYQHNRRWFYWVVAGISFILMLQASSGGAQFIFFVLFLLSRLTIFLKKLKFKPAISVFTSFIAICIFMYFFIMENIEKILGLVGKDLTLTGRTDIWPDIIRAIQAHLWFGYGTYGFWQSWRGLYNPARDWIQTFWMPPNAHQGFLDICLDLGLIGLLMFAMSFAIVVYQSVWQLIHAKGLSSIVPIIMVTFVLMSNLSESKLLRPNFIWSIYVLLAVKLSISKESAISNQYQNNI